MNAAIKAWVHQNLIIAIFITITNIIVIIIIRKMCAQLSMGPLGSDHLCYHQYHHHHDHDHHHHHDHHHQENVCAAKHGSIRV